MERFRLRSVTKVVGDLLKLCRRLVGRDREAVRETVNQTLQTARVNHVQEFQKAQVRRAHFGQNRSKLLRSLSPDTGTSLLHALNQTVELKEVETAKSPDRDQMILPPQTYRDRYTLALVAQALHNSLTAVVTTLMMQHDYLQREARNVFELLTQHGSSSRSDAKFYEKRTEVKDKMKDRLGKTDCFQLAPGGKEIQTTALSESEADASYTFQENCASLLGEPFFAAPFDPSQPIPALASNADNFDKENAAEHIRIGAVVRPSSLNNLIESLGYKNMKKKAQGPVLSNVVISGNGNNGNHGMPQIEESEADTQADINAIVDRYLSSVQFRSRLKHPKLEVVVDGAPMSSPFAAASASNRWFWLPGVARFVQIFATENGRRDLVSNLSLQRTDITSGITWNSKLELEGKQIVSLMVEPKLDHCGKLAGSSLVVGYQPRLTLFEKLVAKWTGATRLAGELWPSWMTKPIFAAIVGGIGLAPLFTIDIFSLSAFFTLILSLTVLLLVVGRINPAFRLVRPQQVALDAFVALMLIAMLFLGILPPGRATDRTIEPVATASATSDSSSRTGARNEVATDPNMPAVVSNQRNATKQKAPPVDVLATLAKGNERDIARAHGLKPKLIHRVEVLVDTREMISLVASEPMIGSEIPFTGKYKRSGINEIADTLVNPVASGGAHPVADQTKPTTGEAAKTTDDASSAATVASGRKTSAVVVFESPTPLGNLNKGDVLNANFKPIAQSATDPRGTLVGCTARGVVKDVKRTSGTDVEVRVGLSMTWVRDGNIVNWNLDLLLTDCAKDIDNSHYGVLATPQNQIAETAHIDPRLRKQ